MAEKKKQNIVSEDNLVIKASRSRGPGGQNVNKVNTRITVFFDVAGCESFTEGQRNRILKRLATRADKNGVIHVASQRHRTQKANRTAAVERLNELLMEALKRKAVRRKTAVPHRAKQRRLEEKKRRSVLKRGRAARNWAEDSAD